MSAAIQIEPLTTSDLELALHRVNDYESFAKSLIARVMQKVLDENALRDGIATIPVEFTLKSGATPSRDPNARTVCVDVCVLGACIHVFVE